MVLTIKKTAVEKRKVFRLLFLAILLFSTMIISIQSAELDIAYDENFNHSGSPALGWTTLSYNTNKWSWRTSQDSGNDYSMYCDSIAAGPGEIKELFYYTASDINCLSYSNLKLQFYMNYSTQEGTNDWVQILYATSDYTFHVLKTYTSNNSGLQLLDLSACNFQPSVRIAFLYSGNYDGQVYIDDVKITHGVQYTNVNYPSNGDAVFRYLEVGSAVVGHTGIFWKKGPNPVVRDGISSDSSMGWVIQSCGTGYEAVKGYSVDYVPLSGSSIPGGDFLQGSTYWGAYMLRDVTKEIRAEIIRQAKIHIGKEDYPSVGLFFSNAYKNPDNDFLYPEYPNGSFRCDGFVEYCYEKAFGDSWAPGNNEGIYPNDNYDMSPEGQMRWMNNESIANDGYDYLYHGGGRDAVEDISPPTVSIASGPSGTIDYNSVTFSVGISDNHTPDANIFYKTKLDNYESDWSSSWTENPLRSWSYSPLPDGLYTFRIKARDLVGNESGETTTSFTITTPAPPGGGGGGGGGGPVGPLAAGISALLVWWKRRKQRQG